MNICHLSISFDLMTCFCHINLALLSPLLWLAEVGETEPRKWACYISSKGGLHCFVCILDHLIYADKTDIIQGRVVLHAIMANDATMVLALEGLASPREGRGGGLVAKPKTLLIHIQPTLHTPLANWPFSKLSILAYRFQSWWWSKRKVCIH